MSRFSPSFPAVPIAALLLASPLGAAESWCVSGASLPDLGAITRTIDVAATSSPQTIVSARVRLVGTHPWVGDLRARLVHPSGSTVTLLDRPGMPSIGYPGPWGCGGDNFDLWLGDAGTATAEGFCPYGATPALSGVLRPNEPLAALAGLAPAGAWSVVVEDAGPFDSGSVATICLELETAPDCNRNGTPDATDIAAGTSADADGDGVPDECACNGDLNADGSVSAADLALLLASWGPCAKCPADLSGDGVVAADDLAALLSNWGPCQR